MATLTNFDSLTLAKNLQNGGFDQKQAETLAKIQSGVVSFLFRKLATKKDILATKKDILATKKDINRLERRLDLEIKDVHREIKDVRREIKSAANRVTVRLGATIVGAVSVLAAIKFF